MFLFFIVSHSRTGNQSAPDRARGGAFPENASTALQGALGLDDWDVGGIRGRAPEGLELLVARLLAAHLDIIGVDVLAETRNPVGTERVAASDHPAAVLDADRHLGVGYRVAAGIAHETEIGRALVLGVVVVPEGRAAGPYRDRHRAGDGQCHAYAEACFSQ